MIAEALADAATIIAAEGLAKGSYRRPGVGPCGVQHCTVGAIREACGWYDGGIATQRVAADRTHEAAAYFARQVRARTSGERFDYEARIIRWSDANCRTTDQVVIQLLAAAADAEAEGV